MQTKFRARVWIAVTAAVALLAAGCSEAGPGDAGSSGTSAPAAVTDSESAAPASNSEQPGASASGSTGAPESQGGGGVSVGTATINYQLYLQASSFNPFVALTGGDGIISLLQFQPLLSVANNKYVPRLAEKWSVSDDAKTYTFTLRDAQWSDGKPITAEDVIYTIEANLDPKTTSIYGGSMGQIKGAKEFTAGSADKVAGLSAPDEHTVKVELASPNSAFLADWAPIGIVPEHIYSSIALEKLKGNEAFRSPAAGSGPYVFSKWVSDDVIEFVANPKFWADVPAGKLIVKYLAGDAALAQLETGEVDVAQIPAAEVEPLKAEQKVNVLQAPDSNLMTLHTALKNGKLADKRVRQAVLYAINRQAIVDKVLAGQGKVAESALFAPDWAQPADLVKYDYNPDKAKQLLADAGWKADTVVHLDINPGQADRDAVMNIVAGQLNAVGMKAELTPHQPAQMADVVKNNEFDLLITALGQIPTIEPARINIRLMCDQQAPAGVNITGYCNKDLDKLLEEGVSTTDQAKRKDIYQQANKIINDEVPIIPLYVPMASYGVAKRISGFDPTVPLGFMLTMAEIWHPQN